MKIRVAAGKCRTFLTIFAVLQYTYRAELSLHRAAISADHTQSGPGRHGMGTIAVPSRMLMRMCELKGKAVPLQARRVPGS